MLCPGGDRPLNTFFLVDIMLYCISRGHYRNIEDKEGFFFFFIVPMCFQMLLLSPDEGLPIAHMEGI